MGCGASAQVVANKWEELDARLPFRKSKVDLRKREVLFKKFDQRNRNSLSVDDCHTGCVKHLRLNDMCSSDLTRVNQAAFDASHLLRTKADATDGVDPAEFRLYLQYLRDFFEYSATFDVVDRSGDGKISKEEFKESAARFRAYGVPIADVDAVFREVDTDKRGTISFAEFCDWASQQELEREKQDRLLAAQARVDAKARQARMNRMTKLKEKVAIGHTARDVERRRQLFVKFDGNGNGRLSEDECLEGARKYLNLDHLAINKAAFAQAKASAATPSDDPECVNESEFGLYLIALRDHHELNEMFMELDQGDAKGVGVNDREVTLEEFKRAVPKIEAWGKKVPDVEAAFAEIDADGKGTLSFPEFCVWACQHHLDVEEDDKQKDAEFQLLEAKREVEANLARQQEDAERREEARDARAAAVAQLNAALATSGTSPDECAKRNELFDTFDAKAKEVLTLDECAEGATRHLRLSHICGKDGAAALNRVSFATALPLSGATGLDRKAFQAYAVALRNNFELNEMFMELDQGDAKGVGINDREVTLEEFKRAVPKIEAWGKKVPDVEAAFAEIDADGKGTLSFSDLCLWANQSGSSLVDSEQLPEATPPCGNVADFDNVTPVDSQLVAATATDRPEPELKPESEMREAMDSSDAPAVELRKALWADLRPKFPLDRSRGESRKRLQLFKEFDRSGSGALSQEDCLEGASTVLELTSVVGDLPSLTARSFAASGGGTNSSINSDEFRIFLMHMRSTIEIREAFDDVDACDDVKITRQKFITALPRLQAWGMVGGEEVFDAIDTDGQGQVDFNELASFIMKHNLDREREEASAAQAARLQAQQAAQADPITDKAKHLEAAERRRALWESLRLRLPRQKNQEENDARNALFKEFDLAQSGAINFEECRKGCVGTLHVDDFYSGIAPILQRSFYFAANARGPAVGSFSDLTIERAEFRIFLVFLYDYLELFIRFEERGLSIEDRVDENVLAQCIPVLESWGIALGGTVSDTFDEIDVYDVGSVDFGAFSDWAVGEHMKAQGLKIATTPLRLNKGSNAP